MKFKVGLAGPKTASDKRLILLSSLLFSKRRWRRLEGWAGLLVPCFLQDSCASPPAPSLQWGSPQQALLVHFSGTNIIPKSLGIRARSLSSRQ